MAGGEDDSLCWRIFRGINGKPQDVEGFETSPKRMGRVGQAAMREGVSHQQIAEFVVNAGVGNGKLEEKHDPQGQDKEKQGADGKSFMGGKTRNDSRRRL